MQQMGEAEWNALSEKDQQKKLMEIKLKEKQLRKDGKVDEARQLLEALIMTEQGLFFNYYFLSSACICIKHCFLLTLYRDAG